MSSYRRHTVLAVVFASLDEANPCPLSNATARRMLPFGLDAAPLPLLMLVLLLVRLLLIVTAAAAYCHYSICNCKHLYNLLNTAPRDLH